MRRSWCRLTELGSLPVFTPLKPTADAGDHYQDTELSECDNFKPQLGNFN